LARAGGIGGVAVSFGVGDTLARVRFFFASLAARVSCASLTHAGGCPRRRCLGRPGRFELRQPLGVGDGGACEEKFLLDIEASAEKVHTNLTRRYGAAPLSTHAAELEELEVDVATPG
jgi:hypothetical protein